MKLWRWTVNVYVEAETLQEAERIVGAVLDEEFPAWTAAQRAVLDQVLMDACGYDA